MRLAQGIGIGLFIAVAITGLAAFGTTLAQDTGPAPRTPFDESFTYQGRLEIDGVPANGIHTIIVELWDAPTGGNLLTTSGAELEVTNGLFSMIVGAGGHLDGERRWLQALVASSPDNIPLGPRQELTPVAYAVFAKEAGGLSSAAAAGFIQNGTVVQPASSFHVSGNGKADGTLDASAYLLGGSLFAYTFGNGSTSLAIGPGAGSPSVPGIDNTLVGINAGTSIAGNSGFNTAFGAFALTSLTDGQQNSAVGSRALTSLATGFGNTAVGDQAGFNTTGSENTFLGTESGYETESNANTAVGYQAGRNFTSAVENVFVGRAAGKGVLPNSTGSQNVAVGANAGFALLSGTRNAFFGHASGDSITSGGGNTLIGAAAGSAVTTGGVNTMVGNDSGISTTGSNNTYQGWRSGFDVTTGGANTFVGGLSGENITEGSNNSALGYAASFGNGFIANSTVIGAGAQASASNQVQLGRDGTDTVRIGLLAAGPSATDVCLSASKVLVNCSSSLRYKTNSPTTLAASICLQSSARSPSTGPKQAPTTSDSLPKTSLSSTPSSPPTAMARSKG